MSREYIAALDIGTTNVRCHVIDSRAQSVGSALTALNVLRPRPGYIEIDPDECLKSIIKIIHEAISDAHLQPNQIKCLAITTQRSTFITWKKDTGEYLHNFITWNDMRATELIKKANKSMVIKLFQASASLISMLLLGRNDRYTTASRFQIANTHCTGRLLWAIKEIPEVEIELKKQNLCFATIETWLIYKLTGGRKYVSDISSASSTGLYDPFESSWSVWYYYLLNIPLHIYPKVVGNDEDLGCTDPEIFGASIPIACTLGDQQSALFGSCCFKKNTAKITMGTGSFININTGESPPPGSEHSYPLVGWRLGKTTTFLMEAACKDAGTLIVWAQKVGISTDDSTIDTQVSAVNDTDGAFFIPAFSGLSPPIADEHAATGFIGVKATTTKDHLLRAILESIVFTVVSAYDMMTTGKENNFTEILVAGGVSRSIFICQMLADMTRKKIVRYTTQEQTLLGAAFMAGLNVGVWNSREEIAKLQTIERVFEPVESRTNDLYGKLKDWQGAAQRFTRWY